MGEVAWLPTLSESLALEFVPSSPVEADPATVNLTWSTAAPGEQTSVCLQECFSLGALGGSLSAMYS